MPCYKSSLYWNTNINKPHHENLQLPYCHGYHSSHTHTHTAGRLRCCVTGVQTAHTHTLTVHFYRPLNVFHALNSRLSSRQSLRWHSVDRATQTHTLKQHLSAPCSSIRQQTAREEGCSHHRITDSPYIHLRELTREPTWDHDLRITDLCAEKQWTYQHKVMSYIRKKAFFLPFWTSQCIS